MVENLSELLAPVATNYYFGSTGFCIEGHENLSKSQTGYAVDTEGHSLISEQPGSWKKQWVVVARDTCVGDPIFVDIESKKIQVFTAMHGAGAWEPELLSESLEGFIHAVQYLQEISGQNEELIEPGKNTPTKKKKVKAIRQELVEICGKQSKAYWKDFFDIHMDWVEESKY